MTRVGLAALTPMRQPDEAFRQTRRMLAHILSGRGVAELLLPVAEQKTRQYGQRLLQTPEKFADHLRW